jgi:Fe-S-cluster-containing dehydrogenase component
MSFAEFIQCKTTMWFCNDCNSTPCIGVCRVRAQAGTGWNCVDDHGEKDCSGDRLVELE